MYECMQIFRLQTKANTEKTLYQLKIYGRRKVLSVQMQKLKQINESSLCLWFIFYPSIASSLIIAHSALSTANPP